MYSGKKTEKDIVRAIMEEVAFFDLFDYPLTKFELWRHLSLKCRLAEAGAGLEKCLKKSGLLGSEKGFYYLSGREAIIETRLKRYNYTNRKFRRAVRLARFFKFLPWVKMIAAGNMIGSANLKDSGDIDLFIITRKNRIWITRFFTAGLSKLLNLRPKPANKRDKFCLSFYISEDALNINNLKLKNSAQTGVEAKPLRFESNRSGLASTSDPYFIFWLAGLAPIYNSDRTYEKFIEANSWIYEYFPNWQPLEPARLRDAGQGMETIFADIIDLLIGGLESSVKKFQLKIMPMQLKSAMNKGGGVVVDDQVLKLYAVDKREEYRARYRAKIRELEFV